MMSEKYPVDESAKYVASEAAEDDAKYRAEAEDSAKRPAEAASAQGHVTKKERHPMFAVGLVMILISLFFMHDGNAGFVLRTLLPVVGIALVCIYGGKSK